MHKIKNQKPTTNPVAQKQADTLQINQLKQTQAPHILRKEEDNLIYRQSNCTKKCN